MGEKEKLFVLVHCLECTGFLRHKFHHDYAGGYMRNNGKVLLAIMKRMY